LGERIQRIKPMDIRKGDTIELAVEKVVYGGRGLAHLDKMAIFVDKAVPGDRVTAKVVKVKKDLFIIIFNAPSNSYAKEMIENVETRIKG